MTKVVIEGDDGKQSLVDFPESTSLDFVIGDWVLSAGRYILNLQHNLEGTRISVTLYENGNNEVIADRVEIVDNNNVRIYASYDPDCRFAGRATIFKTQE